MKVRSGFVSNSSSSSFILDASKYNVQQIKDYITKLLEAYSIITKDNLTFKDICKISEEDSIDRISNVINRYYGETISHKGKILLIDSTHDNSIPWSIQEALIDISLYRQHWG